MPKPRSKPNEGLPTRWRYKNGAYYYRVPPGQERHWDGKKEFRLGAKLSEAFRVWANKMEHIEDPTDIAQLLERYALEVVPDKAPKSQEENHRQIKALIKTFGSARLLDIKPLHIYRYYNARTAKTAAKRELEVLSHAFTKAVEWGLIDKHPYKKEVVLPGEPVRDRLVEDWEIDAALSLPAMRKRGSVRMIQAYIILKLMTGMDRSTLLRLRERDLREDGIHIQRGKVKKSSGKRTIYAWSEGLRQAVALVKTTRPLDLSEYLFSTKEGKPYLNDKTGKANAWDSMWQRFMDRVIAETDVEDRFQERDLRAKAASDALDLEHARALLSHADSRITQQVYRRKPEVVVPNESVWVGKNRGD